jgi:hypothetical protein
MQRLAGTLPLLLGLAVFLPVYGQDQPAGGPPAQPPTPIIKLAITPKARSQRALQYELLPPALDLTPGNAASVWLRAGHAASSNKHQLTNQEHTWSSTTDTPLKDLPRKEVRALVADYEATFRLAERAARCNHCDWEMPPLTIQTLGDLPLNEIQMCRQVATLLAIRCRLELAEGHFDDAARTLQTGFALARHIGEGETLIEKLVAIAIAAVMIGRVEEFIQTPGAPNLYWSLTTLPHPFIDLRRSIHYELNTIYRSLPQLRELTTTPMSKERAEKLVDDIFVTMCKVSGEQVQDWQKKLALATLTTKAYPDAKQFLLSQGRKPAEVEAMPVMQVVALYYVGHYDQLRDEVLKWLSVPYWQGHAALERVEKEAKAFAQGEGNVLISLLMPAFLKTHDAQTRLERLFASLRCAEALRLYAAEHQGKAPAKLTDITEVPLPIDPYTGKGFEGFYQVTGGTAVLDVPPPPRMPPQLGRRFELPSVPLK